MQTTENENTNQNYQLPMKRLITLFTGLLFIALPVVLSGCDDSDEQVNRPDERFVSGVVIPTALDVCEGLEMTIEGQGFRQGDAVTLRGDSDMPAQTTGITPSSISFVLPTGIEDQPRTNSCSSAAENCRPWAPAALRSNWQSTWTWATLSPVPGMKKPPSGVTGSPHPTN